MRGPHFKFCFRFLQLYGGLRVVHRRQMERSSVSAQGKALGERTAVFTCVVSCCGVVVCVWFTGTKCKVALCLLEGKAFGGRATFVFDLLFVVVVRCFLCGSQAPDVKKFCVH